jgi:hypothetical protein
VVGVFRGYIFYQRRPAGPDFLTAKDTKYTKGWMIKLPPRFRILVLRMTFQPIRRSIFQRRGKRKSPRLGGEGLGEDGCLTNIDFCVLTLALTCVLSPWRGVNLGMILVLRMTFRPIQRSVIPRRGEPGGIK